MIQLNPTGRWANYSRNVPMGKTVYGRPSQCDYLLAKNSGVMLAGLAIKVCVMEQSGSVDEKYPYWIANMKAFPYRSILVLDGIGQRLDAVDWAKKQVDGYLVAFVTIDELNEYLRR